MILSVPVVAVQGPSLPGTSTALETEYEPYDGEKIEFPAPLTRMATIRAAARRGGGKARAGVAVQSSRP
jgi:hypothetical protein